jgi:hypothetical protein
MDDKITIIEGPTPSFDDAQDAWAMGIYEGSAQYNMALTKLRTFNGPALVERCYRTWKSQGSMILEYRDELGLTQSKPILAVRSMNVDEGQVLFVWLRLEPEDEAEANPNDSDTDENFQ